MLTLYGKPDRLCGGLSRRSFLTIGGLTFGGSGLGLSSILRAESQQAAGSAPSSTTGLGHKAVINVFLAGGPPHQDMWEIKTEAPSEIRGEFRPIPTNVPGIQICEVFPKLAAMMDKAAVIRSVVGCKDRHESSQCLTGWISTEMQALGGRPSIGSAAAKLQGAVDPAVPAYVGLAAPAKHAPWSDAGTPGFLGTSYAPFKPDGPGMDNMKLNDISLERLRDRRALLSSLDNLRRDIDTSGMMAGMDAFGQRALDVLTSSKLLDALDLTQEDPAVVERYGDGKPYKYQYDGAPTCNDHLLIARRLVEAGARCVSLSYGRWDSHGQNFDLVRDHGTKLDQCLSALISDLDQRGILDDVTVVVWGEFGRTPKINASAGRDHWSQVSCAYIAGGGIRAGQAIGATNRLGEHATERPVDVQEIIATLYHNLGIDTATTAIVDPTGRPQYLVDASPVSELI
ncbi:DUF1501 domain-containing protein [Aureliella helgolandensis]|uniref:DUF1501 domain-containing protein n=1 Tax=Aureliella helgolandensis TaxID=2527968 RepID=A0A518G096_9BACT|nr:DUF1501 domain-containing protein [Aureliella helgolandensis]QDV22023.1 hypothetical protein Q31a_03020 [Aureliella helgolandensis]